MLSQTISPNVLHDRLIRMEARFNVFIIRGASVVAPDL